MNRILKTSCIIALSAFILTSCSSNNNGNSPTPTINASQTETQLTPTPSPSSSPDSSPESSAQKNATRGSVNNFSELFAMERILDIKKASDSTFYNTSRLLLYSIADLLTKAEVLDNNNSKDREIASKFDIKKYDYVLQFDGAKPIFVSVKDNIVFFEDESKLYKLWGDSKNLWENLTFDETQKIADINEKGLEIMEKRFDSDINEDGKTEKVSLVYKGGKDYEFRGDLILRVENSDITVLNQTQWQINPSRTISQPPIIYFMPQKDSKEKVIIVTLTWLVDSLETLGDVFAYSYSNGKLTDLDLRAPETNFNYSGGNTVKIEFPQTNSSQIVKFDNVGYEKSVEKGKTLKDVLNDKNAFTNNPLYFKLEDFDGDGIKELCSMSSLVFDSMRKMSIGIQYTYYKASNNKLAPVKIIVAPPYIDDDKEVRIERYIMDLMFDYAHITLVNGEIKDSWYKPSNAFKKEEIAACINKMISEGKLYKKGDSVFVKTN
ncbi:MAG TPA: hypothetical protein PK566_05480 [Pseudobacteroides sp.]|nr:hypothetical protein [Pseudobacteroides sp.]